MPNTDIFGARSFIAAYDLKEIIDRLVSKQQLKRSQAFEAAEAYRHFMLLVWVNHHKKQAGELETGSVVPSTLADIVWHGHILFTQKYREFCEGLTGSFIDHAPNPPGMIEEEMLTRREYTRNLHREIPDRLWFAPEFLPREDANQKHGGCGDCDGCDCE